MKHTQEETITALQNAKGIAYYGEILLEVHSDKPLITSLREAAHHQIDQLVPAGDVMNVLCNIDTLQRVFGDKLHAAFQQQFIGPISIQDGLSSTLLKKLPFAAPQDCLVVNGEIGLCHLGVSPEGDMLITLDTERAAIRDAINNILFKNTVVQEAQTNGIFFSTLIGLAMQRNHKEFTDMFNAIHHSGTVTVFDTNYRSYVMEHCYPQQNNRRAIEVMADIIPNTDVLVAGSEDIFALEPEKERSIERAKDEFFNLVPLSSLCVLKAGKDGAYWRDGSGSWHHIPANPVNVRSTTGAGDAFNAGLLLAMRNGKNFKDAMTFAGVVASKIVASNTSLLTIHEASDLVFVF